LVQCVTPLSNTGLLKPEQRDVMTYTNLEGRYDDEEAVEKQVDEQPEQMVVIMGPPRFYACEKDLGHAARIFTIFFVLVSIHAFKHMCFF
jgi:hypothetical protein